MPLLVYKILFCTELCYAPRCDWEYLSQPCHTRKPTFSVLWDSRAILGEETKRVAVNGSASIFSIFSIIFQLIGVPRPAAGKRPAETETEKGIGWGVSGSLPL
ncbi:hypothetical protein AO441_001545 [Nakaseomyces glabratus]|nr:hypothetical protein AO439_001728 [Nakaseomyces glabratus]KTB07289.1 hypothetical protein AO441_001545 [Nakaseomyces glabratus]